MRKRLFRYITMALSLWIFLGGSIGQVYAQDEFNPTPPPEPGKLTLLLSTDPHGSAYLEQTNPSGIYDTGTEVTVRAYPHTDYEFVAWQSADGEELSGLSEYTFTLTEKNARLIAKLRFNPKENPSEPGDGYYNLITTVAPSMAGWVEQSGQGIYENGKEVTLIAHAYPDYVFDHWESDGKNVSEETTYRFTMPGKHVYLRAVYDWKPQSPIEPEIGYCLYVNTSDPEAGYVSQSGNGIYELGDEVTVIASPTKDYDFIGWYDEAGMCLSTDISYTLTISKRTTTIEARFKKREAPVDEGKLEAKFRELPVDLEVEGGENGWAEVTRYRGDVINLKAEPIVDHTFMGWYLLDQLLSKALHYDFDVNILRAVLPAIRAVYTKGTVANETIAREELVTIAFSGNQLCVTARQAIRRLMVYSFEGDLLGTNGQMEQGDIYRLSIRSPLLLVIEATDGTRIVCKLSSGR